MTKLKRFSNYEPGYAEGQLAKLRQLRSRLIANAQPQQADRLRALRAMGTFEDYQSQQRVGGKL